MVRRQGTLITNWALPSRSWTSKFPHMLSSTFLKKIVFKHSFLFKTWTTVPKVLLWSLTVILCRQQGKQSEAAGLDISNIIGVPSPSVRVRMKGLLEEQFEYR